MRFLSGWETRQVTIIEPSLTGHRADQLMAISELLGDHGVKTKHKREIWPHVLTRDPLLFPSVDGLFLIFVIIAPLRALFLLRTVAIWHRPKTSTRGSHFKHVIKAYCARVIKKCPMVALISVQRPQYQPEIAGLFTAWIDQIAQWHRPSILPEYQLDYCRFEGLVKRHAKSRAVVIYLGEITAQKGFEFFTDICFEAKELDAELAFVAAGKVTTEVGFTADRFRQAGGLLIDKYLSDAEFLAGIDLAGWVWNCYRPDNDQNSGIFGFAYQVGARVIVRTGSFIERLASDLEFPVIHIEYGNSRQALEVIVGSSNLIVSPAKSESIRMMRERTRERLLYYLGFGGAQCGVVQPGRT
jgi:hypothetical protein